MAEPLVVVENLSRTFGSLKAVEDLSLQVSPGEVYGLVGPDGAGKTTAIRMVCGVLKPDRGRVAIGGYSIATHTQQARQLLGYLSQRFSLYEELSVLENLHFFADVRGLPPQTWMERSQEDLSFVGLAGFKERRAGLLSGGMKQKLGLAIALINRPALLLLDEPTTGVDPATRRDFWQLISRLVVQRGMAVLVSTPYMDEAERCTRVGFLRNGRLITEGTPRALRALLQGRVIELAGQPEATLVQSARSDPEVENVQRFGDRYHLRIPAGRAGRVCRRLNSKIRAAGGQVTLLAERPPLLEDVFIALAEGEA